ncbi:MAG: Cobalt-zinc-cadmium resistance protein CzcA; Cation efflux system protein CusA [uncultured Campylobacterales bacterium]|uniref:Cobalt-zinc-cadmium resistance protein CzcA Cation efflux system protein CusA n=1 Tax=uncultured Campylobacterales bacterium TaxID=352960 RepID=A0A6S6SWU9_9BACT|nr:MAG: Cobalt-zinc-cadmium resistance protein CzcA; Cation efflux system protein CusA [uncultured Campylobacterales bacterium]
MLSKIIDISLKQRLLVLISFTLIALFGYQSYKDIPIDAFPDITPNQVVIYTESDGNSAEDIEKLVTYPIEIALSGLKGVKSITSNSIFGLSYVSVFFEDGLDNYFIRQLVYQRLSSVDIPEGWGKPTIGPNTTGLGQVFWYEIKNENKTYSLSKIRELQEYTIAPLLKGINGVEEVVSWGGYEKQYSISILPHKLQEFDIKYQDVLEAIRSSNISAGGQYLEFNDEQYLIQGSGFYNSLEDIENSIIKHTTNGSIKIKDISKVSISTSPRFGAISIDTKESVIGMVLQRTGTNASKVVENIKQKLPLINKTLPKGVEIRTVYDRSDITKKALNTMQSALISGIILVTIILFLFLFELRSAFIVVLSIPMSLLLAFIFMRYLGISSNLMSLSGLAIAIGMIVDATIVIVENSFRNMKNNQSIKDTIKKSTKEVISPITFATLIIIAVFIPLLSLDGLAGKLYYPMILNIVLVMISSLIVALVLVPPLCYYLLKPKEDSKNLFLNKVKSIYSWLLDLSLSHPKKIVFTISIIFVSSCTLLLFQGKEFMPKLNEESIMYRMIALPGTSLTHSTKMASQVEDYILKNYKNEVSSVLSMIGRSEKGETAQANYMEVLLNLKESIPNIKQLGVEMTQNLKEEFPYLQFVPTQPIAMRIEELLEGIQSELGIKIYGEDQKVLNQLASKVQNTLKPMKSLNEIEVESQLGQAQIQIKPRYDKLSTYGVTVSEVMDIINYALGEKEITQKIEGLKRYPIVAKLPKTDIQSIKKLSIKTSSGAIVSLDELCSITIKESPAFIKRENLSKYIVLSVEVQNQDVASFVNEANELLDNLSLEDGYYLKWVGDFKNLQETTNKLMLIIPITLLLVMLLLYMAFNSLKKTMLILLNVPLALIGAIVALILAKVYLSISAIVGFIIVFAIAVLNAIVLVSFIDSLLISSKENLSSIIKQASLLRLRPVLMTAFTTLLGILPLLFTSGVGSEIQYPLAIVVTGGIISSTILTLLILPTMYFLFYRE